MKNNRKGLIVITLLLSLCLACQEGISRSCQEDSTNAQIEKVKDLVSFLEFSLNMIGSKNTPQREKDIIITESYNKIFRDAEVQIEDDLDLSRSTVTNKDVQAYLKDVDFFFRDVNFELDIEEIDQMVNDSSQLFYLVKLNRNLTGKSISGDTVNQTITRYIEVNYNEQKDDLKIVSYYTTKLSEKEDLLNWWDELTFEWKYIFQNKYDLFDSIHYEDLKKLVAMDSLDISSNQYIHDFEPLFKLDQLTYLDISNTNINDLSPLRIHNKLEHLDISNTGISNIDYLRYASSLRYLNASDTELKEIGVITDFNKLEYINLSQCAINPGVDIQLPVSLKELVFTHATLDDYRFIKNLKNLEILDLSFSNFSDVSELGILNELQSLFIEATEVQQLESIGNFRNLEILNVEGTVIDDLEPLSGLSKLEKIFCDNSQVSKDHADEFMKLNPGVLVIFDSEELRSWWIQLDQEWKNIFMQQFGISENPEKDELARITQIDSLNVSGNKKILDLKGIEPLKNLKHLNFNHTYVREINTVSTLPEIQYLNAAYTNISSLDSINFLKNLSYLNLESTTVQSIEELSDLRALTYLNLENTGVSESEIVDFIRYNPACLVMYRGSYLDMWWKGLNKLWKDVFIENLNKNIDEPDDKDLHRISYLRSIKLDSTDIVDLSPLNELNFLEEISIIRTSISDLEPLKENKSLESLIINRSPVSDISPLIHLKNLRELDISNTGVSEIDPLAELTQLQLLKLSGIQIKKINPLENLKQLKYLDISNTNVKKLNPVEDNFNLEMLICYNTRLNERRIDDFKTLHPNCKVVFY